ncbi:MAG: hypothetical protein AAB388_02550 [Patescibacteria group bacterium]
MNWASVALVVVMALIVIIIGLMVGISLHRVMPTISLPARASPKIISVKKLLPALGLAVGIVVVAYFLAPFVLEYNNYHSAIKQNGEPIYMMDPDTKQVAKHRTGKYKGKKITTFECRPEVALKRVPHEGFDYAKEGTCSAKDGTTRLVPYNPPKPGWLAFPEKAKKLGQAYKDASTDTAEASEFVKLWQNLGWQQYLVFLIPLLLLYLLLSKVPGKKVVAGLFVISTAFVVATNTGTGWSNRPKPLLEACYVPPTVSDRPIPLGGIYLDFCGTEKLLLTTRDGRIPHVGFDPRFIEKYKEELEGWTPYDFLLVVPAGVHDKVWVKAKDERLELWLSIHLLDRIKIVIYP